MVAGNSPLAGLKSRYYNQSFNIKPRWDRSHMNVPPLELASSPSRAVIKMNSLFVLGTFMVTKINKVFQLTKFSYQQFSSLSLFV
jgi:hypothetical protein